MVKGLGPMRRKVAQSAACFVFLIVMGCGPQRAAPIEGYYRYGFEQSAFYPVEGGVPFWLEAEGASWDQIHAFYVDGPGRGGGMTLHLTVEGDLQSGGGYGHLGAFETRLVVTNILVVEAISDDEFQAAVFGSSPEPAGGK